jgi:putative endonuclease
VAESWFCYMVRCRDGSFYVGIATDVEERVRRHDWGVGPGYAKRRPMELVWMERRADVKVARKREKEIKGWSRAKKLELIAKARRQLESQKRADAGSLTGQTLRPPGRRAQGKGESSNG